MIVDTWHLQGYALTGSAHVSFSDHEVVRVIARYAGRGGGWMRFVRKIGADGWWVTHHGTKLSAMHLL